MSSTSASTLQPLSENQKAALIRLLGDEDPSVYTFVRGKLLSYGSEVSEWLRPHALSSDPLIRKRTQEIVTYMSRQAVDNQFVAFCLSQGEDLNLEEGIWLLSQTRYPQINVAAYQALLDSYAGDLQERLTGTARTSVERILKVFSDYLFQHLRFTGNEQDYYDPANSYFNQVLDRRTGNPISLSMLYLFLGKRLGLPLTGIGLPGHFLCRYQSPAQECYVDPFNRGKLLTKADCVKYLLESEHGFQEGMLTPLTPRRILLRVCTNLHQIYTHQERVDEGARLQRYLVALAR